MPVSPGLDIAFLHLKHCVVCVGLLPLVVAFLNDHYTEAASACNILRRFCSWDVDPCNIHTDLLARIQGVRRLSVVLEIVPASNAPVQAPGMTGYQFHAVNGRPGQHYCV